MAAWVTVSFIDHLKPIGDQIQEELDQLEARWITSIREAQAGEPSFFREFTLSHALETRMNRRGEFSTIYKKPFWREFGRKSGFC